MTLSADVTIRAARPEEVDAIAAFHVFVWRNTYRDLAPLAAYQALDVARRRPDWQARLASACAGSCTLLALDQDKIAGLVSFGPARHPELRPGGEVYHLYVDPDAARRGIGASLLALALQGLCDAGHENAALAVVEQNYAARAFDRALGGVELGQFTDPGPLWRSENIITRWPLG